MSEGVTEVRHEIGVLSSRDEALRVRTGVAKKRCEDFGPCEPCVWECACEGCSEGLFAAVCASGGCTLITGDGSADVRREESVEDSEEEGTT